MYIERDLYGCIVVYAEPLDPPRESEESKCRGLYLRSLKSPESSAIALRQTTEICLKVYKL